MAALTKTHSLVYSNQRDENTCAYHVFCKLLLKNVVELFYPLPIDEGVYDTNRCNRYLDTKDIELTTLTPEECTQNGYLKIILFHYFYSLYDIHLNKSRTKEAFSLVDIDVANAYINRMFIPERVTQRKEITDILSIVNHAKRELGIQYYKIIVYAKEGILDIIRKILSLGFYIGAALYDKYSQEGAHARHAVHIVAVDEDEIIFKNSWGDERVYNMKVDAIKFKLGPYQFKIEYFLFYLPCKREPIETVTSPQMPAFSEWIDDYVRQFPEMMADLPTILATMPTSSESEPSAKLSAEPPKSTFAVGDVVTIEGESTPLTISEIIKPNEFNATYLNGEEIETRRVFGFQLTKVGGTRKSRKRRRKSRKRIR